MKKKILLFVLALIILCTNIIGCKKNEVIKLGENKYYIDLEYSELTKANPLKGFFPYENVETDFPHSLKYYGFPLKDVQIDFDEFDWTVLEESLEECQKSGKQAVVRFYLDYPGQELAMPDFLLNNSDIEFYNYELEDGSTGITPDYSNEYLQDALVSFINAFGEEYDGDSRIGFIECGLLGFWGEWHTYPYDEWYPNDKAYRKIGEAFDEAFDDTFVMVGEVQENVADLNIGFHDDMLAIETKEVKTRLEEIGAEDKYLTQPIGSELAPSIQDNYFKTINFQFAMGWDKTISLIHPSWSLVNAIEYYEGNERKKAIAASNKMGYNFTALSAETQYETEKKELLLALELQNVGIAPFYYEWGTQLMVTDEHGKEIITEITDWDITSIKELNNTYTFNHMFNNLDLKQGSNYNISLKVINPMEGGMPLLFSNETQNDDGWIDLITITIDN